MTRAVLFACVLVGLVAPAAAEAPAKDAEQRAREWFTDTEVVDQRGRTLRFYSDVLRDRVVVLNFIYTRCPDACPLLTRQLQAVRAELGEAFGRRVFFVSISLDAGRDTPEALRAFARKHGADVPGWTFLTGAQANVDEVVRRLGQYVENPADHATTLIAGNVATRHWTKLRPDLPPAAIAAHLQRLLAGE